MSSQKSDRFFPIGALVFTFIALALSLLGILVEFTILVRSAGEIRNFADWIELNLKCKIVTFPVILASSDFVLISFLLFVKAERKSLTFKSVWSIAFIASVAATGFLPFTVF